MIRLFSIALLLSACGSTTNLSIYESVPQNETQAPAIAVSLDLGVNVTDVPVVYNEKPCELEPVNQGCFEDDHVEIIHMDGPVLRTAKCRTLVHELGHAAFMRRDGDSDPKHKHTEFFKDFVREFCATH